MAITLSDEDLEEILRDPAPKARLRELAGKAVKGKRYYKTRISVEVLTEEPFDYDTLADVHYAITEGGASGVYETLETEILSAAECAKALRNQGSDSGFFGITAEEERVEGRGTRSSRGARR